MLVIMSAGKGTRMKLPEGVNKCSTLLSSNKFDTSINRLIKQFDQKDVIIIIGYGAESVVSSIDPTIYYKYNIHFVYNPFYGQGSSITLKCALPMISYLCETSRSRSCYFVEGDSVYSDKVISEFISGTSSCIGVRSPEDLSNNSVVVISKDDTVKSILYDKSHSFDFSQFSKMSINDGYEVYESLQLWSLSVDDYNQFTESLVKLKDKGSTNLFPFIELGDKLKIHKIDCAASDVVNLNTKEDLKRVKLINKEEQEECYDKE